MTGLGAVGVFQAPVALPGSAGRNFGDVAIGPGGQVMVSCFSFCAYADRMTTNQKDQVTLEGNVRTCSFGDPVRPAENAADKVVFGLNRGSVNIQVIGGK